MKGEKPKNIAASVHSRLLTLARQTKDELQLVLMRYGLERLLYRLSESDYTNEFVVKGAMLFLVWTGAAPVDKRFGLACLKVRFARTLDGGVSCFGQESRLR